MSAPYSIVFSKLAQEKFDHFIHKNRKTGEQIAKAIDRLAANTCLGEPQIIAKTSIVKISIKGRNRV